MQASARAIFNNESIGPLCKQRIYACVSVLNNVFALEGNKAITIKRQLQAVFIMFNLKIERQKWT